MNRHQRVVMLFGLLLISALVLGCANSGRVDDGVAYQDDLDAARQSLREAEQAGAAEYGNVELGLAREKLRAAESAAQEGDGALARRLAIEADLDADLAVAKTRNQETQALAGEMRSSLQTLEEELRRSTNSDLSR